MQKCVIIIKRKEAINMMIPGCEPMRYSLRQTQATNNYKPLKFYKVFYQVSGKLFANNVPRRYRKLVDQFVKEYQNIVGVKLTTNNAFIDNSLNKSINNFCDFYKISLWIQSLINSEKYKIADLPSENIYAISDEVYLSFFKDMLFAIKELPAKPYIVTLLNALTSLEENWNKYDIQANFLISMETIIQRIKEYFELPNPTVIETELIEKEIDAFINIISHMNNDLNQSFREKTIISNPITLNVDRIRDEELKKLVQTFYDKCVEYEARKVKTSVFYSVINEVSQILESIDTYNEIPQDTKSALINLINKSISFVDTLLNKRDNDGIMQISADINGVTRFIEYQLANYSNPIYDSE